jgi:putative FmdB family regulatory protein
MPNYDFRCTAEACLFDVEVQLPMADRDIPSQFPCPECGAAVERYLAGAPGFGDPMRLGRIRTPDAFKDILRNMKKKMPYNHINTQ